jgi:hypothetical protein
MSDPIVDEIRRIRDEHAAAFGYDIDAIFRDIKRRESESGKKHVSYPPRPFVAPAPLDLADSMDTTDGSNVAQ